MKTLKAVMLEAIEKKETMIESLKQDIEKIFSSDKKFNELLKKATENEKNQLDLVIFLAGKQDKIKSIMTKYKTNPENLVKSIV